MIVLFGYMDFIIIYKWLQYWPDVQIAPSIITTMINIPLKLGKTVIKILCRKIVVEDSHYGELIKILHKIKYN